MSHLEIILLALALSVDACVVSFSYGLTFNSNRSKNATLLALFTGGFQGLMPVIGYFLTSFVRSYIEPFSHWIIFGIFTYLGIKFIVEAFEKDKKKTLCISLGCLFMIGIATSIDAFSAGISLSLMGNKILKPALLIALITFINSILGFWLGGKLKHIPTKGLEISAGIILILLGLKALMGMF
ncbi:MAG: manganese efflux pump MntP family protein [bacterium]|nr:manganese efflux pump MntP family protein [bacterium]